MFFMMPVFLRFLTVGCVASGAAAMTLLLGIARFFSFMTFVGTHVSALNLIPS